MPTGDLFAEQDPGSALVARGGSAGGAKPIPRSETSRRFVEGAELAQDLVVARRIVIGCCCGVGGRGLLAALLDE